MTSNPDDDDIDVVPQKSEQKVAGRTWMGRLVLLLICGAIGTILLIPAIQGIRRAAIREQDKRNLEQIGIAIHNYHLVYQQLPPGGFVREDGTEMLNWQACLLPYLDQTSLYNQIKPQSGWDSSENRAVFSQPIACFMNPAIPVQPGPAVSHYAGNSHLFGINMSMGFRNVTDGMTNTIAVGDVSTGFKRWGDPTNVRDPGLGLGNTPQQFGSPFSGGCHFLLLDGSVRFVPDTLSPAIFQKLATPDSDSTISGW